MSENENKDKNKDIEIFDEENIDVTKSFFVKVPKKLTGVDMVKHTIKHHNLGHLTLLEKKANGPITIHREGGEVDSDPTIRDTAFLYMYNILAVEAEGHSGKNWQEKVPAVQKIKVMNAVFTHYISDARRVADKFGDQYVLESDNEVVYIVTKMNDLYYLSIHVLSTPGKNEISEYRRIQAATKAKTKRNKMVLVPGVTYEKMCALYDQLFVECRGYTTNTAENVIPMQKVEVITHLFSKLDETNLEAEGN